MKLVSPFLVVALAALLLTGCNTVNTRRDLYSPKKGSGYWTTRYERYDGEEGIFGVSKPRSHYHQSGRPGDEEGLFGISKPKRHRGW